jgi:hypothetical protein
LLWQRYGVPPGPLIAIWEYQSSALNRYVALLRAIAMAKH